MDVFFFNTTGFAVARKEAYRSTNSGTSWTKIAPTQLSFELCNIGMGSDTNAFLVNQGSIWNFCTHNGGNTFDTIINGNNTFSDVFFTSPTVAYAAGKSFWKTTNGGNSWSKLWDFGSNQIDARTIYFLNEQTGWMLRTDGLFKTTNGGLSWQMINVGSGYQLNQCNGLFYVNPNHGFFSDDRQIAMTTDAGIHWNTIYSGKVGFHDIHFLSDSIGYIADVGRIMKTTDGGYTWTREVGLVSGSITEIHFKDANHGWACGLGGVMLKYEK
jgi:photosystem II stability/assembly factor-like uncharacterized protein